MYGCESCLFSTIIFGKDKLNCHRNPPIATVVYAAFERKYETLWPEVNKYDWCGEHKPKTKKE